MTEKEILEDAYKTASQIVQENTFEQFENIITSQVDVFIDAIENDKSLTQVIVTSLLKKIITPKQDIRLHMKKFKNGYSARVLDTKVTSPFFKDYFPKYANKETAFLTKATRAEVKWDMKEGQKLPFRNKKLVLPFISLITNIQNQKFDIKTCLIYIFAKLIALSKIEEALFESTNLQSENLETLNIHLIIKMLQEHFESKISSRLPVIAIYSIYQALLPNFERYKNKKLVDLQVHTSSDKHGFGDIEIYTTDNQPFEIVEIKHNIPIDKYLIFDIAKKTQNIKIDRYYILTTFANGFESAESEKEVTEYILNLKKIQGIDIIANGIITTLKYYLRFIDNYQEFIDVYTQNLIKDAKNSTEIKNFHLEKWTEILKRYELSIG
jgi:DNA (cytosine-5)-methyltransferase 1